MTGKRVAIGLKPGAQKSVEDWVTQAPSPAAASEDAPSETAPAAVMKRLTIDISEDLHRRLKVKAATEDVRMADLVRRWIEEGCA